MQSEDTLITNFTLGNVKSEIRTELKNELVQTTDILLDAFISIIDNISKSGKPLGVEDAAKYLSISRQSLGTHTKEGRILSYNGGGKVYYKVPDLLDFLIPNIRKGNN